MNILIVSPTFPYPTFNGLSFDIWSRIPILEEEGFEIDMVYTENRKINNENLSYVQKNIRNTFVVERKKRKRHFFHWKPMQIISRDGLKKVILIERYDVVFIETEHCMSILNNPTLKATKIVLRVHNNELKLASQLSKSNTSFFWKIYFYSEGLKYYLYHQTKLLSKIKNYVFISSDDLQLFSQQSNIRQHLLPTIRPEAYIRNPLNTKRIIYVVNLDYAHNRMALQWYLKNVHPTLLNIEGYSLRIVGSISPETISTVETLVKKYRRVETFFNVENLNSHFQESSIFINPTFYGSGVKIKSLLAVCNGLPLISTSIGIEGIGFVANKHFLLANDAGCFTRSIESLLNSESKRHELVKQ